MKVKRLEICGFKSFADTTKLDFPEGLCAVVGPNGCGKSNVVDSIRWVLGEQRARQLRGQAMEDVIFNGATSRKNAGLAEVSVVFENNGDVKASQFADLSEIMVTRRLYRSGDSEYLINKVPCRLKDIQQLLMDTGLGNRDYAIIEQGRVAGFIDARPEERRLWVEEAAGITRFKAQKKISLRKMKGAQENLDRVGDILHEVEVQMARLKRQAAKARRHKEIRAELHELDLKLSSYDYAQLLKVKTEATEEHDLWQRKLFVAGGAVSSLDMQLEKLRLKLMQAEQEHDHQSSRRMQLMEAVRKSENDVSLLDKDSENNQNMILRLEGEISEIESGLLARREELEKASQLLAGFEAKAEEGRRMVDNAAGRVSRCQAELNDMETGLDRAKGSLIEHLSLQTQYKNRLSDLERGRGELLRRREQLAGSSGNIQSELAAINDQKMELTREQEGLKTELRDAREEMEDLRLERQELMAALKELRAKEQEYSRQKHQLEAKADALSMSLNSHQWVQGAVKNLLKAVSQGKVPVDVLGLVADKIKVAPGKEDIAATALGPDMQAVLVRTGEDARDLGQWVLENGLGRVRIIALDGLNPGMELTPRGLEPVSDWVKPQPGFEPLAALVEASGYAQSLGAAYQAGLSLRPGQLALAGSGTRFTRPGSLDVGKGADGSVLAKRNELQDLQDEVAEASSLLEEVIGKRQAAEHDLAESEEQQLRMQSNLNEIESELRACEHGLVKLSESYDAKTRQSDTLEFEVGEVMAEIEHLEEERGKVESGLAEVSEQTPKLEDELNRLRSAVELARHQLEESRKEESAARLEAAGLAGDAQQAAKDALRLKEEISRQDERLRRLKAEKTEASEAIARLSGLKQQEEVSLSSRYDQLESLEAALNRGREEMDLSRDELRNLENDLKRTQEEQREAERNNEALSFRLKEVALKLEQLCQQVLERCHLELEQAYKAHLPEEGFKAEPAREELEALRRKLHNIGPVNMEAIAEYEALQERHTFLLEQKEDLEGSLADLQNAIRKINKTSRQRFVETLAEVNSKLEEIFPLLFKGGGASLALDEGVDPLEAGLELMVELPGKKVKNLEAMSGGEKALSALAVLFALFLIRPAPFCILDEVDAPLDEVNTGRFHELVRKLSLHSQILMITHNRGTMEIMDLLYGVTMEEKGVSRLLAVDLAQGEEMAA